MGRYGGWEDRPWESREGGRDRWRREQQERGWREDDPWRRGEYVGARGGEEWRGEERGRWEPPRSSERRDWRERQGSWPETDTLHREVPRGLMEFEDRGPLDWVAAKIRELKAKRPSRGPKGYTRSDERIEDDVAERLARSGVSCDDIEVKVENREVTLTGIVPSREEKWWIEALVDDVFGVEEVHSRLRIARESGRATSERAEARSTEKRDLPH